MDKVDVKRLVSNIIPALGSTLRKGLAGRIGVLGGCTEYTGAPYYSAISSLKSGADLTDVFCTVGAGPVIKSYSPELVVHPYLSEKTYATKCIDEELVKAFPQEKLHLRTGQEKLQRLYARDSSDVVQEVSTWLPRLHVLVIGPGLGRHSLVQQTTLGIITEAIKIHLPLIIDADGLYLITQHPYIIKGYKRATLTPNLGEFQRLYEKVCNKTFLEQPGQLSPDSEEIIRLREERAKELSIALGHVTILSKGEVDIITNGNTTVRYSEDGSVRRCGGQGDVLSGITGTFTHWAVQSDQGDDNNKVVHMEANMLGALGGCMLTRKCATLAFTVNGRTMTAPNMISLLPKAFMELFPDHFYN